jgi:multidrug efflux system outer membrane protein
MGPDFRRPDTGVQIPGQYQHGPEAGKGGLPVEPWWQAFGDPILDQLVAEVLSRNLDIQAATARILEARAQFIQVRADRFPGVDFQAEMGRQRLSVETALPTLSGFIMEDRRHTLDAHGVSFPASFEVDLWGRLARAEEAARARLLEAEENQHTVAQTVVANTVSLYLRMEAIERQIQVAEESIRYFRRSRELLERRYERGLSGILDVRQARRILAQAEAFVPTLRRDLGVAQQEMSLLLGRYPETHPPRVHEPDAFKELEPVPVGLPSELLLRRPDVRRAEARLKALNAEIGVAKASRFPRISLTGNYGYSSEALTELLRPEGELWSLAFGLVQPLFDAGRLKAGQRAAEARYRQGVAEYAKTLLTAFAEVEGALMAHEELTGRREKFRNFFEEARATQRIAERRYLRGLTDYLTVLEAQQTRVEAEENMVLVDLELLNNRVTLHRALGGGWARTMPVAQGDADGFESYLPW